MLCQSWITLAADIHFRWLSAINCHRHWPLQLGVLIVNQIVSRYAAVFLKRDVAVDKETLVFVLCRLILVTWSPHCLGIEFLQPVIKEQRSPLRDNSYTTQQIAASSRMKSDGEIGTSKTVRRAPLGRVKGSPGRSSRHASRRSSATKRKWAEQKFKLLWDLWNELRKIRCRFSPSSLSSTAKLQVTSDLVETKRQLNLELNLLAWYLPLHTMAQARVEIRFRLEGDCPAKCVCSCRRI
jgi:hypothetical protein